MSILFFGTYEFQFFDARGHALSSVRLSHPLTIHFHPTAGQQQQVWQGQSVYAFWNQVQGSTSPPALAPALTLGNASVQTAIEPKLATTRAPTLAQAQINQSGKDWSVQSTFAASGATSLATRVQSTAVVAAAQASTVTFGTQAPQATWGNPTDVQVGLNSGGLSYSSALSVPAGPGGLQPSLALNYSSGSVDENHNVQATSPWVGQGWSLDLGSISWSQQNVTPTGTATLENVWNINDPSGIGGQLIPPDLTYSTAGTFNPSLSQLSSGTYLWHTAPESHAKVQEIVFGSYPCWRVWLPNGIMEEFGCTNDSRQSFLDSNGVLNINKWQVNLMTDRYGNQVHITYQKQTISNTVLDSAISDITYDDPSCHNTTTACSTWNPKVDIHFDHDQKVTRLLSGDCSGWTAPNSSVRCDDPVDLTGSGGLAAPKVMGAYVLNDVKVNVNGNLLHEYDLSYNQGKPNNYTDPATGQQESIAGYLTLGKIEEKGTGGTALNAPSTVIAYQQLSEHYSDLFFNAMPTTNCSPDSGAPHNGSDCYLWSQTYHQYYISNLDNGRGWNESITWKEAHANTWGVDGGAINDSFTCTDRGQTSTNICGRADDKNWSHLVVSSRTAHTNGISSTWTYHYYLQTGLGATIPGHSALSCTSTCAQTYTWGNQNDSDYADYYNGTFESFKQVQVIQPDGSSQTHVYGASPGWGLANSSIACFTGGNNDNCVVASYYINTSVSLGTVFAGKEQLEQDYNASGSLQQQTNWSWLENCPPTGVSGSVSAGGGSVDPGSGFLFSEIDRNNPVMVCDPRIDHQDTYLTDGVTSDINDSRVVHKTVTYSYDGDNQGVSAYDYGNVSKVDTTSNDVGGIHFVQGTTYAPNDNLGSSVYLTGLPAFRRTYDGSGTYYGCTALLYGSNTSAGQSPTVPAVTQQLGYPVAQSACNDATISTKHTYDSSGNPITAIDPDGHVGCGSSTLFSACASYDGFNTHLVTASNAKNQQVTYHYDTTAATGGYGQWLLGSTDANGHETVYTYDALGRVTSVIQPGDTPNLPTASYTYTNTCNVGITSPCLELDTTTRPTSGIGTTITSRSWYDGMGRLVETQSPGPNPFSKVPAVSSLLVTYTIYDNMGHATTKSLPYAISAQAASGGSYVDPDLTQARTVTGYDSTGRAISSTTYSNASTVMAVSTTAYTVAQGIPSFNVDTSTPFEQTIMQDAYKHQSVKYTDALGRDRYDQVFSGTGSPYMVVRTVQYNRDVAGNVTSVVTYNNASTGLARTNSTFDGLKRLTGFNDWDQGDCNLSPMPASCSNASDTAWKVTYDANGNVLSKTDPRNVSTYTSYDALDRPLCMGTTSAQVNPCQGSASASYFYDSYDNSGNSGVTFPSGCSAPGSGSSPVGHTTAETFSSVAGSGWRCSGYDQRGQSISSGLSVTADGQTTTQNVSQTYNDLGEGTSLTYPDGEVVTSTYDNKGYLHSAYFGTTSSTDPVAFLVGLVSYTNSGQLAGLAIGGTASKTSVPTSVYRTTLGYDDIQRPISSSATVTATSSTLWNQARKYDNIGNSLSLTTTLPMVSGGSLTDNQSFCYDALSRLVWAGNSGTPTGGDHCGSTPGGSTTTAYAQSLSYDAIDRMTQGPAGTTSYSDASHVHAATTVSTVPNPYASYDAMGNMTCRNTDTTGGQSCASGTQTGVTMTYDNAGRLATWTAPQGSTDSDQFLYDNAGNRVLQRTSTTPAGSSTPTVTDTITFDGFTEVTITGSTTNTTNYYSVSGQRLAMRAGSVLSYLVPDFQGSSSIALNADGSVQSVQLYAPYGGVRYNDHPMPTTYNFTGQRLDGQTGLLYYNARYYDPVSGTFLSADKIQGNAQGMNPYSYVGGNPETRTDPTGQRSQGPDGSTAWVNPATGGTTVYDVGEPGYPQQVVSYAADYVPYDPTTDTANSTAAKLGRSTGLSTILNPTASLGDKVGAAWHGINNLLDGFGMLFAGAELATGEGLLAGGEEGLQSALAACGGGLSFTPTTKVATKQGEQAIGTLKVGEQVWAYNPQTKKMELQPILHVWINHDNDLVDLTITKTTEKGIKRTSEVLHTNKKHPFLTVEKGFLPVGQIKLGMHVVEADGQVGVISGWKVVPGVKVMYNLEVAQDHTFTVGAGQWIVHNCGNVNEVIQALKNAGYNLGNPPHFEESLINRYTSELGNITAQKIASVLQDGEHYYRLGDQAGSGALKFTATLKNISIIYNSDTNELISIFSRVKPQSGVRTAFEMVKNWENPFRWMEDFR